MTMRSTTAHANLRYLEAELKRIDLLISLSVRRWLLAGQDPDDDYRGLYVSHSEAGALLSRPLGVSWGQAVELPEAEVEAFASALAEAERKIASLLLECADGQPPLRLARIAQEFKLTRTDLDILLICLAPAFDIKYERLYGYLQDNVTLRRPAVRLVLDLLGSAGIEKYALAAHLSPGAVLLRHGLVSRVVEGSAASSHWINQALQIDETVVVYLLGEYEPHGVLRQYAALETEAPSASDVVLAADSIEQMDLHSLRGQAPILALHGIDRVRQDAAARVIAQWAECPLLIVDMKRAVAAGASAHAVVQAAVRDALLAGAAVYLRGWDCCLDEDLMPPPDLFDLLCESNTLAILSSAKEWRPVWGTHRRPVQQCPLGLPDYGRRQLLWEHFLLSGSLHASDETLRAEVDMLAREFVLSSEGIRNAAAAIRDAALEARPTRELMLSQARAYSSPRLHATARKVTPRYGWNDLVLPEAQLEILRELVANVQLRTTVLNKWGLGKKLVSSSGVSVLFAGPPGTGKTMAAELIAGELGLDLYKIDLSAVVSKYIGETEKNLESIFSEAATANVVLLFDEADALFGKRSEVKDAHDRYANLETSYLLQRMESYEGVAILATNFRANLDEAFARRLQFAVDFPFPQLEERRRIWTTLFPDDLPRAQNLDFDLLARRYALAGGNIRNIIVSAAYLAASNGNLVTMEHLLHGVRRELQKMGRTVSSADDGWSS
jgi:hypothetical protein